MGGLAHQISDNQLRVDVRIKQGEQFVLDLGKGLILDARGSRKGMSAAAKGRADLARVNVRSFAAGHELNSVLHASKREQCPDIFHFQHLVGKDGEIAHVVVQD